jgi:hypothetical protein
MRVSRSGDAQFLVSAAAARTAAFVGRPALWEDAATRRGASLRRDADDVIGLRACTLNPGYRCKTIDLPHVAVVESGLMHPARRGVVARVELAVTSAPMAGGAPRVGS